MRPAGPRSQLALALWRDNKKALRAVFKQSVQLAVRTGCAGLALQARDQTELQVVAENADLAAPEVRLPVGLAPRQALREEIKKGLAQLAADGRAHHHPVEPEARRMKRRAQNRSACNAPAVADAQAGVIVACEATRQENDGGQLVPMLEQARKNPGVAAAETLTVADTGYGAGPDRAAATEKEMQVLATPAAGTPARDNPSAAPHCV